MNLIGWQGALALSCAFLLIAVVVRRLSRRHRDRVKRVALFLLFYLASFGVGTACGLLGWVDPGRIANSVAHFLAWVTLIDMAALALFELALPKAGFELPSIVGDLAVGGALFVLIVAGMRRVGVDPTSIVATSAVVTGILALSLQPTLGNVIGGLALQLDRSVRVGDWLQLENGNQGRVREIRWRHTVIETRNWDTIVVPNSSLLAANIIILGKREGEDLQHRMWVYFNVDFRYRPADVIETVEKSLRASPWLENVAQDPAPNCICFDFAKDTRDSFCYYAARYWLTDLAKDDPTSSKVRERIFAALQRANIPLAIPAAQLFLEQDDKKRRQRKTRERLERRLAALKSVEFLHVLNDDELESVAQGLLRAPFATGETITRQGDKANWLYILAEGQAEVRVSSGEHEQRVATLEAPTFFGEMGLMTGERRGATVIATDEVLCYRLNRAQFRKILRERPSVAAEISALLASRDIQLRSAKDDLDASDREARVSVASTRLLSRIQDFFGLADDEH